MDELAGRRDALRQAAIAPDADPAALLEAALTELDGAIAALGGDGGAPGGTDDVRGRLRAERRMLHAAFQQSPAALFLLAVDGTIRRASDQAVELLGARTGYATGKPLTVFVDPPQRAAVQTQLAAVVRTGHDGTITCRVVTPSGPKEVTLALAAIDLPGEPPVLAASLTPAQPERPDRAEQPDGTKQPGQLDGTKQPERAAGRKRGAGQRDTRQHEGKGLAALTRRLDMVVAVTGLLLDNATFSEAVTIQRCARLLAGELADWVIVDVVRGGGLRRQVAAGPRDGKSEEAARVVRGVDPGPSTLPWQVHETAKSVLLTHIDDEGALGTAPDGAPLLMTLRATSVLAVPITDGNGSYGTLTLTRSAFAEPFTLAEQALAEDLACHLGTSLRVDQVFRRRAETAEALQASLLPEKLPEVPGLDLAASAINATRWQELSGDFYDVFRTPHGWAAAIGDVCGIGQAAAAMTAAARHTIRALAHGHRDPAEVLAEASEVLLDGDYGERFVTALLAVFEGHDPGNGDRYRVRLGNAGHPGPAIVRADGRVEIASGAALPLGLLPDNIGPGGTVLDLEPGDLLFLYTNGVTHACTDEWEYFEDRFADTLAATAGGSAAEAVRAVTSQLTEFCRGDFRDDVTMLAMRVL